jgi:hypothetical protein
MKTITVLLLSILALSANAQSEVSSKLNDTLPVNNTYKDGSKNESYFVNTEGNKVGKYVRFTRYGNVYTEGQYDNGSPVGIWKYYAADTGGALVETLDFSTHKETFLDSANVNSLVCGPRYFGGNSAKQEYVQLRIITDFTEQERAMMKGKMIMAVFTIDDKSYKTMDVTIEDNALPYDIRVKMQKIVVEMPAWLAPVCDKEDKPVWRQSVVFVF